MITFVFNYFQENYNLLYLHIDLFIFEDISSRLSQIVNKYGIYYVAGDLNINMFESKRDENSNFYYLNVFNFYF